MRELNGAVVDGRPMRLSEAKRNERFSWFQPSVMILIGGVS
jgi:hypothetical protein